MKTVACLLASLIVCCLMAVPVPADEILLGTPNVLSGGGGEVAPNFAEAEGFYLTRPILLTGINIGIFTDTGGPPNQFLFQLVDRIGPGATVDVLASFAVPPVRIPTCLGCIAPPYLALSLPPLTLGPDGYFLLSTEIQCSSSCGAILDETLTTLPSTVGAIGPRFFATGSNVNSINLAASNWSASTGIFNFQLLGTVAEPPSLILLTGALGLFAAGLRRRRPIHP